MNIFAPLPSWDGLTQTSSKHFYDISQMAGLLNRRFYRQGLNWAVASIKIHFPEVPSGTTLATTPAITISKLPNTWILSNSWEKGMRAWLKMVRESTDELPSVRPRFLDFKIYANDAHHQKGSAANILPIGYTGGEWEYSTYHIPNAVADASDSTSNLPRDIIAVGPNYTASGASGNYAVSLIEGYAASRSLPQEEEPNVPADAASINSITPQNWIAALDNDHNQQDGEVVADLVSENNQAPYPFEGDGVHTDTMYPGGANQAPFLEIHGYKAFAGATVGNQITFQGGNFPCGLIEIINPMLYKDDNNQTTQLPATVQITLVPGTHRGYLCQDMKDM